MNISSGESTVTTSGAIIIPSPDPGAEGVSGAVVLGLSTTSSGPSDSVRIARGADTAVAGGAVSLTAVTGA